MKKVSRPPELIFVSPIAFTQHFPFFVVFCTGIQLEVSFILECIFPKGKNSWIFVSFLYPSLHWTKPPAPICECCILKSSEVAIMKLWNTSSSHWSFSMTDLSRLVEVRRYQSCGAQKSTLARHLIENDRQYSDFFGGAEMFLEGRSALSVRLCTTAKAKGLVQRLLSVPTEKNSPNLRVQFFIICFLWHALYPR